MKDKLKVGVLASGRGSNFEALAKACQAEDYPATIVILIVDNPDAGALKIAERMGIESVMVDCGPKRGSMTPASSEEMTRLCKERGVGLVCLAGFMRIVKGKLLEEYGGSMLNIHPALLPSFGGQGMWGHHVHEAVLKSGCRISGCTVHFCTNEYDKGPIIVQRCCPVKDDDTPDTLAARVFEQECIAYPQAINLFARGKMLIQNGVVKIKSD